MGLFVLDLDGHEMDVVQVSVDPNHLNESIGKYEHHHHEVESGEHRGTTSQSKGQSDSALFKTSRTCGSIAFCRYALARSRR